jgi:hypothetical protein
MQPRSSKRRLRVLCDLRPAFSGNSGIPNETRLMFQLLLRLPGLETIGLINHPELMLARTFRRAASLSPTWTVGTRRGRFPASSP